jgi:hypothetical protein
MLATATRAKLPDVTASVDSNLPTTTIVGEKLNVIALNPKGNFSNIIASSLNLLEFKTTNFDATHNIVIFILQSSNAYLKNIHFEDVTKQGIESFKGNYKKAKVTYFVVIDKNLENFDFTYFNPTLNKFQTLHIPIVVEDDSVTTQSDLKPRDQSHDSIKIAIAATITLVLFLVIIWRKNYLYLLVLVFPLAYIAYLAVPQQKVCIKQGVDLFLLPMKGATVFETTKRQLLLEKEGSIPNLTKVKLQNDKIGWVKNEDTCTY